MSKSWSRAFARQALSDLDVLGHLLKSEVHRCQPLHFLQMASEKVCKAQLHDFGVAVKDTHSVVRKHLPTVARIFGSDRNISGNGLKKLKWVAAEIDMLAPALKGDGVRQDNVEYPWQNLDGEVVAPVDFDFPTINDQQIQAVVRLLKVAASRMAS